VHSKRQATELDIFKSLKFIYRVAQKKSDDRRMNDLML